MSAAELRRATKLPSTATLALQDEVTTVAVRLHSNELLLPSNEHGVAAHEFNDFSAYLIWMQERPPDPTFYVGAAPANPSVSATEVGVLAEIIYWAPTILPLRLGLVIAIGWKIYSSTNFFENVNFVQIMHFLKIIEFLEITDFLEI